MTPLMAEVNRWSALRFAWGQTDCVMLLADWSARWLGADPAADIRGCYETAAECQRVTRFFTDPIGAMKSRIEPAGGIAATDEAPGLIGVVAQVIGPDRWRPHGAICMKPGLWAAKAEDGVLIARPDKILAAWNVGYAP